MKAFRILGRSVRDAFHGVFRNFSLSLASIFCITITSLVVSIAIILSMNINNVASLVEKDVTIVVFLDSNIDDGGIQRIETEIRKLDNVESISFESKDEIKKDMMASSEIYADIMGSWTDEENPLQDTYRIKVTDIEQIGSTATKIKALDGVDVVKYGEGMVEKLVSVVNFVRKIAFGIVIALIIVTAFLITNTIKITIYSRRREIDIMRLVGASNLNIKIPFIFEGLLLGILGSIMPIAATIYGYTALYNNFNGELFSQFIQLIKPMPFVLNVSGILLVIGVVVGVLGSILAVNKHLKI